MLTAVLFALLDVVIDPVALRGDRWFLGEDLPTISIPAFTSGSP